jgi:putative flavoprotein involved in K+ transport
VIGHERERYDTVVIGGGQAGLATGYWLSRARRSFVILDAGVQVGEAWRRRWDSLRLFTAACFDSLPGLRFPASRDHFPTKDEMADYLGAYAARFDLEIRLDTRVDGLSRVDDRYLIASAERTFEARHVVIATGEASNPRVPKFAAELDPAIRQLHSSRYRHPDQLRDGPTLVVGAGASGAEIAIEVARQHPTLLAGRDTGEIPLKFVCIGPRLLQYIRTDSRLGRKVKEATADRGDPLVRIHDKDLRAAGVRRLPRIAGVDGGRPLTADGPVPSVDNVIWCTGFAASYRWIKLPILDAGGRPRQRRGVVESERGLFFVGLRFQSTLASHLVGGVGRDAKETVSRIVRDP